MNTNPMIPQPPSERTQENIAYVRQMLGELRAVANMEGAEMLRYLIEMAFIEASEIHSGLRSLSIRGERNQATRITEKPAGKIQF